MTVLLERIMVRYPRVAQRCCEAAAIWLAEEAAGLKTGDRLLRSEDHILPGLAQAVRESGVDLAEMARECGVGPVQLRRKLALGRVGELLKRGEVWGLSDQALRSKLQQAADEYSLEIEELLDETLCPSAVNPGVDAVLPVHFRAKSALSLVRCRMCRLLWPQPYRIDFTAYVRGGFVLGLRESVYACHRCLPMHLADPRVQEITRLTESEIPKPPGVRAWSAAFAAIAILVVSGLYVRGSGAAREATGMPALPATAAPAPLANEIRSVRGAELAHSEAGQSNHRNVAPEATAVAPASTVAAPSPVAAASSVPPFHILFEKPRETVALLTRRVARPTEKSHSARGEGGKQVSDRARALQDCRQILHNERPLTHYSIGDTLRDADQEGVPAANACATTVINLIQSGKQCADLFDWFDEFQTSLTNRVKRVCREAARKTTTP
jgi:hypothetical protein